MQSSPAPDPEPPAPAQDQLSWSVRPADNDNGSGRPNFAYEVEAGDEIADAIAVTNMSDVELTLDIYAADGYTTPSGQLDLIPADQASVALGSWVTPEVDSLTLAAGESAEVPFTLDVPEDAAVGDHPGGIVASYSSDTALGNVRQDSRLGSRIHVRVAGEFDVALQISDVTVEYQGEANPLAGAPAVISYTLTNPGNVRVFGHEAVEISGPFGLGATTLREVTGEVLPGDSLERRVEFSGALPLGQISASVQVTPEAIGGLPGAAVSGEASTLAIPWLVVGLIVALLLLAVILYLRRRKRRKKPAAADSPDTNTPGTPGDTSAATDATAESPAAQGTSGTSARTTTT